MALIGKAKKFANDTLGAGVHLAIINDVKLASRNGIPMVKEETGEPAIEVEFKTGDNKRITRIFWLTEKSQWVWDNLCKMIGFDNKAKEPVSTDVVRGKRLWICVGAKYSFKDGKVERDTHNIPIVKNSVLALFFRVHDPMLPPAVAGDPRLNDGVPSGKFLMNKPEELPEDFAEQISQVKVVENGK